MEPTITQLPLSGYDELAPHYREFCNRRQSYLSAVDNFILARIPSFAQSLLDVGAGDGVRGMAIARARNITQVVLCDASAEMVRSCKSLAPTEVLHVKAESLPSFPRGFDVVLCLWNVLGHVEGTQNRIRALTKMRQSLTDPRAVLFLDVNNRHNSAAYGALRVGGRRFLDWIWPDERRGDTRFTWKFGQKEIAGSGHLFTYAEMLSLFSAAGLRIREEVFVDYITGAESKRKTDGQMVFMLGKA